MNRIINGLIYSTGFENLNGWTSDGWSSVTSPAMIVGGALPNAIFSGIDEGPGSTGEGVREGQIFVENGVWTLLYDSGDHITGWRQFLAQSNDKGLTWKRLGPVSMGLSKVGPGSWLATATGWLEKRGSTYYLHRVCAAANFPAPNVGLPGSPYFWDIWTSSNIAGPWTGVREVPLEPATWGSAEKLPGCIIKSGSTYYGFAQGAGAGYYEIGITTSSSPGGNFTIFGSSIQNYTTPGLVNRSPENPKVFYHPKLSLWVMLSNLIANGLPFTDANAVTFSDSLTDWSLSKTHIVQLSSPLDSNSAIGVSTHLTGPDGDLVYDSFTGMVPVIFDAEPKRWEPGWHIGREMRGAVLEPSTACAYINDGAGATNRNLTRALNHTDFIAEFSVKLISGVTFGNIGFSFRSNADSSNGYRLVCRLNDTLLLQKSVAGAISTVQIGSGSQKGHPLLPSRIRLQVAGASIKCWINGELQINTTDASFSSGVKISLSGYGAVAEVRALSMVSSKLVSISGVKPGSQVVVRAAGLPHTTTICPDNGSVQFSSVHFPLTSVDVDGVEHRSPDSLIWGGDILMI